MVVRQQEHVKEQLLEGPMLLKRALGESGDSNNQAELAVGPFKASLASS